MKKESKIKTGNKIAIWLFGITIFIILLFFMIPSYEDTDEGKYELLLKELTLVTDSSAVDLLFEKMENTAKTLSNDSLKNVLLYMVKTKEQYYDNIYANRNRLKKLEKENKINAQFSEWDGSHYNLNRLIKQNMKDADSFKHVETVYQSYEDYLIIKTTYKGTNSFGGVVTNSITVKSDLDGNILEVISQNN